MSKKNRLIVLCSAVLCSYYMYAQQRTMGMEEMFRLADTNSKSIQAYKTGKEAADEALKAAKAQRLPDITASVSASYLGDGRLWDRDFGQGVRIDMPHFGNNLVIEARQVVYAGGAISSGIELAELGRELAELDWQKNRQEVRFLLAGYYLELYKLDNQKKVVQHNLQLTERVIDNVRARHEQGTALKNDITRYELQRETLKLQLARITDARQIVNHQLVTTLHLPAGTDICPDTTLLDKEVQTLAEEDWLKLATQTHLGLRQFSALFKNNRKLKQARLNVRRAEELHELAQEQVENAVQAGYVDFLTSFTDWHTQEKSVALANENYSVVSNRYANEMALLTDMLDASNMKLSADLGLVNARIDVIYHYYKMKYLTHTL